MGTIPAEYLPPRELWPQRIYTLPEFGNIPQRLNSTEELLDKTVAAGKADRVALCFEDKRIPYKGLLAQVNKLGSALRRLGIEEADRVALRLPNIPPAIVANFAVIKIGGVVLPTSALFSRAEIAHVLNNAEVKAVIVAAALLDELEKARPELKTVEHVIVVGGEPEAVKKKGYVAYQELLDSGEATCDPVPGIGWTCRSCSIPPGPPACRREPPTSWRRPSSFRMASGGRAGASPTTTSCSAPPP
jgi:2-aminobenzoate-CoA ligase